jgi:hypothetical protein
VSCVGCTTHAAGSGARPPTAAGFRAMMRNT